MKRCSTAPNLKDASMQRGRAVPAEMGTCRKSQAESFLNHSIPTLGFQAASKLTKSSSGVIPHPRDAGISDASRPRSKGSPSIMSRRASEGLVRLPPIEAYVFGKAAACVADNMSRQTTAEVLSEVLTAEKDGELAVLGGTSFDEALNRLRSGQLSAAEYDRAKQ